MSEGQIVVTGGSRGIGAAIVLELDRRGYSVVSLSRSGDAVAGRGIACDMTDDASVRRTFDEIVVTGPIIGLVNNAGIHIGSPTSGLQTAEYEKVMALNATSVMVASREAYPHLKESAGIIVNIGSFFDKLGVPDNLAYCASKAAVAAMTRCLAAEWAGDGITVMNVAPGYIETDLNRDFLASEKVKAWLARRVPVKRPGTVEEVARLVGAIFSENITFMTGETIYIDGGQGMNH
jgi:NAD(P)-dependent dehydrogenase (short-subunit alcohol dehydrogenase family)